MANIINLSPTTELEAINSMLAITGEDEYASLTELGASPSPDATRAVSILRNVTREVESIGWKFNREFGYEVAPVDQDEWTDRAGVTTTLNVFLPPARLVGFDVTQCLEQSGQRLVDTVIRPSTQYEVSGAKVLVFYDRMRARDGFPADLHPFLYINPIWLFNFEHLPEVARKYITCKAGREFCQSTVGSQTLSEFSTRSEAQALRALVEQHGEEDDYNFLRNSDVSRGRGYRPGGPSGFIDPRRNSGRA